MERVAIVADLKKGSQSRAAELIAKGPPFDLAESGLVSHSVFLSADEVVFVFEAHQVEWLVDDLVDEPFHYELQAALDEWRAIVDGPPRIARERFGWERDEAELALTRASNEDHARRSGTVELATVGSIGAGLDRAPGRGLPSRGRRDDRLHAQ
jgi:hypothetical protein